MGNKALTLMELILASLVISVMMMGVMSINYALQKQAVGAKSNVTALLNAETILSNIMNTAVQAVGTASDVGIKYGAAGTGDASTVCIRTDMNTPTWACYSVIGGSVYSCSRNAVGTCANTDTNLGSVYTGVSADVTVANAGLYVSFAPSTTPGAQAMDFTAKVLVSDPYSPASVPAYTRSVSASVTPPMESM